MTEAIGILAGTLAVIGVLANNARLRWCFLIWLVSNGLSAGLHVHAGMWSLAARDAVFFVLAIQGWYLWGRKPESP
jgi:nicotinamide riboside transporter PnuC